MDGAGLGLVLVDAEHDEAVGELGVELGGRRREDEGDRALHLIRARPQPPRGGVLARGGDREPSFCQEQLEGVQGAGGALLFGDRQHLVGEVARAEVVERLAREGRVAGEVLFGHELADGVRERGLARRAR